MARCLTILQIQLITRLVKLIIILVTRNLLKKCLLFNNIGKRLNLILLYFTGTGHKTDAG